MNKLYLYFLLFFSLSFYSQTPNWQWSKSYGGTSIEDILGIATDNVGNSYVCGYFYSSTLTIGTSTMSSNGNFDFFVAKFDNSGNPQWVKNFGGIYDDNPLSIAIDGTGNVYVTGFFVSPTLVCGTNTLVNSGFDDMFLMKLDASGNLQWAKNYGNGGSTEGKGIATDNSGNVFVTGFFNGSPLSLGTFTLTSNGNDDCFVSKFDANGNVIWAQNYGGNLGDCGNDIATDLSGNIFITGYFKSSGLTAGTFTLNNNTVTSADLFIIKFSNNGNVLSANSAGDMFDEIANGITIDAFGNAFITGYFFGSTLAVGSSTLTSYGGKDLLLIKCNNNCGFLWARNGGGMFDDYGNGIGTDAMGNVYVNGHNHSPTALFSPFTLNVSGVGGDAFIVGYNSNGNAIWAGGTGGGTDDGWDCLSLDAAGNIYSGGFFTSTSITIGTGTLTTNGNADMMIAKINSSNGIQSPLPFISSVKVYPNPCTGNVTFQTENYGASSFIDVLNTQGIVIIQLNVTERETKINLENLSKGIYFIRFRNKEEEFSEKLILY